MPTSYTHPVAEGRVEEFSEFAMLCARAMGALVTMRDEPHDAPIPEEFRASDHSLRRAREAEENLALLRVMTPNGVRHLWQKEKERRGAEARRYAENVAETRRRYEAMLEKVERWEPPTAEHRGLKDFMAEQLRESIRFDCREGPLLPEIADTPEGWFWREVEEAERMVRVARESYQEEVERAEARTRWVRELRRSLGVGADATV
jgi:hypothetical protein